MNEVTPIPPGVHRGTVEGVRIVIGYADEVLTWAWHWGADGEGVVERSRASCRLAAF